MATSATTAEHLLREFKLEPFAPREEAIELGRVRDYLLALGEPADLPADKSVPPLFLLTLGRTRRPLLREESGGVINGGNDLQLLKPVYVGDIIGTTERVVDVTEKRGQTGRRLILFTLEMTYTNQLGQRVGLGRRTLIGLAK